MEVRPAAERDLGAINGIYNHYVVNTPATFDIAPITPQQRAEWFTHYAPTGRHRLLVAERAGTVIGYAHSSPYRERPAYDPSVQTSIYLSAGHTGTGAGRALYAALFEALADEDIHRVYAGITQPNAASVTLHERFGFKQVAYFSEQGRKFGRYWDVAWYERGLR